MNDLLATGTLHPVLPGNEPFAAALSILLTPTRADVARVRLLADFLAGITSDISGLRSATATRTFAVRT